MQLGQEETLLQATYRKADCFRTDAMRDVTFSITIADEKEKQTVNLPYLTAEEIERRYSSALRKKAIGKFNKLLKKLWVFIFGFPEESNIEQKFQALTEILAYDHVNTVRDGVNPEVQKHKELFFPKMTFITDGEFDKVVAWIIAAFTKAKLKDLSLFERKELPSAVQRYLDQVCRKSETNYEKWLQTVKTQLEKYRKADEGIATKRAEYNGQVEKYIELLRENLDYVFLDDKEQKIEGEKLKAAEEKLSSSEQPRKEKGKVNSKKDSNTKKDKRFLRDFNEDFPNYRLVHDFLAAYLEKIYGYTSDSDTVYRVPNASTSRAIAYYVSRIVINANPIRRYTKGIHEVLAFDKAIIDEVFKGFLSRAENSNLNSLTLNIPCAKLTANLNDILKSRNLETIPESQINDEMKVRGFFKKCPRGGPKLERKESGNASGTSVSSSRSTSSPESSPVQTPRPPAPVRAPSGFLSRVGKAATDFFDGSKGKKNGDGDLPKEPKPNTSPNGSHK